MTEEIRDQCGPQDADAFDRFVEWLTELYELEMPHFIDRDVERPLDLARPMRPMVRPDPARRRSATSNGPSRRRFRRRATAPDLQLPGACTPAWPLTGRWPSTRVITLHGLASSGVYFPRGRHPRRAAGAGAGRGEGRRRDPLRHGGRADPARVRGRRDGSAASASRTARPCRPTPWCATPTCPVAYRTLLPGLEPPRVARTRPLLALVRSCGTPGWSGDRLRTSPTTTSTSAGQWRRVVRRPARRDPHARPVDPGDRSDARATPRWHPTGRRCCTCSSRCRTSTAGSTGRVEREPRSATDLRGHGRRPRLPDRRRGRGRWSTRSTGSDQGMERGTPFALAHTFFQTGPFRPANVERRAPRARVRRARAPVPGVGVPMVLMSGRLAADRVDEVSLRP